MYPLPETVLAHRCITGNPKCYMNLNGQSLVFLTLLRRHTRGTIYSLPLVGTTLWNRSALLHH